MKSKEQTAFLPPERKSMTDIVRQSEIFNSIPFFRHLINSISDIILILNKERQIILANKVLFERPELKDKVIYGLRPGEGLGCIHATETEGGCGTTEFCRTCGAAKAIASSLNGQPDIQECRIAREEHLGSLDLSVRSTPVTVSGENFTIFVITDISHEKRRRVLERIFFHDLLNIAGNIRGLTDLMRSGFVEKREQYIEMLFRNAELLIGEIKAQKDLTAAESNELSVNPTMLDSLEVLEEIASVYQHHSVAWKRYIRIDESSEETMFTSDKTLLMRVIGNMLKNALESSKPEDTVTMGCKSTNEEITFWVHNPGVMPNDVQLQIFQRSFSTKSTDRGLGTYSMKLLTERYLNGRVSFVSSPEQGTIFQASYPLSTI